MIASSPLMTIERHSLVAEATPISALDTSIFMPSGLSRAASSAARGPPARIGEAIPSPATGDMTANSTKSTPGPSASATSRLVRGEMELRST